MRKVLGAVLLLVFAVPAAGEQVNILARNLSAKSDNIAPEYRQFDNLTLCVGTGGFMEWTAKVRGGEYYIHFDWCGAQSRPCTLSINGRQQPGHVLAETTGGWMIRNLRWETLGPFELNQGKNTIRLTASGYMPHFLGLVISTDKTPPKKDPFAAALAEATAKAAAAAKAKAAELQKQTPAALRAAVQYLVDKYPDKYARGETFLEKLDAIEKEMGPDAKPQADERFKRLQYDALVRDNPLFDFDKLLFVKRYTYQSSHYYTDFIDGCRHFGGDLCILSLDDGKVTDLVPDFKDGIFGRFDLEFDGQRVLFDYKPRQESGFRIWKVGVDGRGLRQVTFDPEDEPQRIEKYCHRGRPYNHHTDDMHPCYLPDGGICFISSRCEFGILCDGADYLSTTVLYRIDADGRNMQKLTNSPVSEASPSVMNDGRILYTRWEYVDKGDVVIKCLWAMHPDGSDSAEIFGNDITLPPTLLHGRAVPGFNNLFTVLGVPHYPHSGMGTLIRVDINYPIRTRQPMTYITPKIDIRAEGGFWHNYGGQWRRDDRGPLCMDPLPLSDKFFLVAYNPDKPWNDVSAYGLYLFDEFGNRVEIHQDESISCWQPTPLRCRPKPPVLPSVRSRHEEPAEKSNGANEPAVLTMSDVYVGLEGVPRGTIKYLRILETVPRPWAARHFWSGDTAYQQHAVVSRNTHLHVKRMHGIVPVEQDGSARFEVPPDKSLFFQALDEDFMEVQRMRTYINLRPGERRSCIGCHELRQLAPAEKPVLAMYRPPSKPAAQPGETAPRPLYYPTDVQPILDRHCVRCHNPDKPEGKIDLTGEMTELFCRSYENLLDRGFVTVWRENQPKTGNAAPIPPYTLGSHPSSLIKLIRAGHEDCKLSREEFIKLVTWVDANAPYYGSYYGRRNIQYKDHPDFRPLPEIEW